MNGRASALLGWMTVLILLAVGGTFIAAGDRAIGSLLIAFGVLRLVLAVRDYRRKADDTASTP